MTIKNLLQTLEIENQQTDARFPDGSGGDDKYALFMFMNGHGKILNAKVKSTSITRGALYIFADGDK